MKEDALVECAYTAEPQATLPLTSSTYERTTKTHEYYARINQLITFFITLRRSCRITMRLKNSAENISADKVREFYEQRAKTYNGQNRKNITMLQDKNSHLSEKRNDAEISKLLPKLKLNQHSCVLDLACGAGRWLDAMPPNITKYRGIDFSEGMIEIARSENSRPNAEFFTGSVLEADRILSQEKATFNRVLIIGSLMYMNDSDILSLFGLLPSLLRKDGDALICIKASIGIDDRLPLKDFYSEELNSDYNAIYRTRDEYMNLFAPTLLTDGFTLTDEGLMFDDGSLNNRKETVQYYFILER